MFETLFSNHWRKPRAKPVQPKSHSYRSMQQNLRAPKFFDEFSEGESTYDEARKPMMLRGNGAPKHPPNATWDPPRNSRPCVSGPLGCSNRSDLEI